MMRGILIGILVSAPMGPIGMLCIQRTLNRGRWPAFFTGVGAGVSDFVYCLLTGLGLSFVTDFIEANQSLLQLIGSVVLLVYAGYLFGANPSRSLQSKGVQSKGYWKDFASGFLFTFSNPLILFFIIGLFARFSFMAPEFEVYHYVAGYMAIFAGAVLWWFCVTWFVNKVRGHFNLRSMWLINRILAGIIMIMGAIGLITALSDLLMKKSEISEIPLHQYIRLQGELNDYVKDKDAHIGVGVIIDGRDTVEVNGREPFPMMSVYKFPIALAVADDCRRARVGLGDSCVVYASDLHSDTYSPMMETYGSVLDSVKVTLRELLAYSLQMSDNNASDILLRRIGGPQTVDAYLRSLGVDGINVKWSEDAMHEDTARCRGNVCTPLAMAGLMTRFDNDPDDSLSEEIKAMMQTCATGTDRLAKPLLSTGAILGHKTGTGDVTPQGCLQAVNDAGYVHLPVADGEVNGRRYSIAVFITDSSLDMSATSAIIAEISRIVYEHLSR